MAVVVFVMTHIVGVKVHGVKYFKQFMGPVWWLTPLMMPIEIISHLSRPLSLSVRLFGNIMGEDIVLAVVLLLVPLSGAAAGLRPDDLHLLHPDRSSSCSWR